MKRITFIAATTIAAIIGFALFTNTAHDGHTHEEEAEEHEADYDNISLTQQQVKTISLAMGTVEERQLDATIRTSGTLTLRPENRAAVASLMGGIVEGQTVSKGIIVAYIENTCIVTLQREYYSAIKAL